MWLLRLRTRGLGGAFTLSWHSRYCFPVGSVTCFRRLESDVLPLKLRVWKVGPTRSQHEDREVLFLFRADLPRPRHDVRPQRLQGEAAVDCTLQTAGGLERAPWSGLGWTRPRFTAGEVSSSLSDAHPIRRPPGLPHCQEVGGIHA